MIKEFKEFISRGNVIDLAVGVIIGGAFSTIVSSLVNDVLMPLIGIILGGIDFSNLSFKIGDAKIMYGSFIQNVIVSRKRLGSIVFSSPQEMDKLTNATWPFMENLIDKVIRENSDKIVVLDWQLLPKTKYIQPLLKKYLLLVNQLIDMLILM